MPSDQMTADEIRWNEQAVAAASSVLSDSVEAATRAEQVTTDMMAKQAGVGAGTRKMAKGGMKLGMGIAKIMPGMGSVRGLDTMRDAGLPATFVLAVTPTQVHAIEVKEKAGADLAAGKVLSTWDRAGFRAQRGMDIAAQAQGVPPDRQMLTLYLPNAKVAQMTPGLGMPTQFMVGRDAPSEALVQALVS
jgi:hypothetical protein